MAGAPMLHGRYVVLEKDVKWREVKWLEIALNVFPNKTWTTLTLQYVLTNTILSLFEVKRLCHMFEFEYLPNEHENA